MRAVILIGLAALAGIFVAGAFAQILLTVYNTQIKDVVLKVCINSNTEKVI